MFLGIAGDPDLPCFRINRLDAMITVDGASLQDYEKEVEYVALNGHIPSSTLEYLTNVMVVFISHQAWEKR